MNWDNYYNHMIDKDIQILEYIKEKCRNLPILDQFLKRCVSTYPFYDIGITIWMSFVLGTFLFGSHYFWIVILNLGICYFSNRLIKAKRPVEYNTDFQPLCDISEYSYGFPSIETYMSVVIFFDLVYLSRFWILLSSSVAILLSMLVGGSRLYGCSRFVHQIVGSWILGFVGLIVIEYFYSRISFHRMTTTAHGGLVAIVIFIFLCILGLAIESNDSRILSIPKKEYLRVLVNIIEGDTRSSTNDGDGSNDDTNKSSTLQRERRRNIYSSPRSEAVKANYASRRVNDNDNHNHDNNDNDLYTKRDSFYYLQKHLQNKNKLSKQL